MEDYENRIVAFIDILGFKDLIKNSENNPEQIQKLLEILKYIKAWDSHGPNKWDIKVVAVEEDAQRKGLEKFDISGITTCTCFSDSIVVSVQCENELINEKASTLIGNISKIGAQLLQAGILIRGAMTVGNLIHTHDGIIMGPAMIEAYLLESNYAKNPRIILSDKLIGQLNYPLERKRDRYPYHQYINRFEDGCAGFHQMQFFQVMQSEVVEQGMLKYNLDIIRNRLIDGLDMSFSKPEVFLKYKWLMDQYNELIILEDKVKKPIHDVKLADSHLNIHYSPIDQLRNREET